jgi:WD40 repeat protein
MAWFLYRDGAWRVLVPLVVVCTGVAGLSLVPSGQPARETILGRNEYWIRSLVFSPDGKTIAASGGVVDRRQELVLWDVASGQRRTLPLGEGPSIEALGFSPDGKWLGLARRDLCVKLLDVASGREEASFASPPGWQQCLFFSPDSRELILLDSVGSVSAWNLADRTSHRLPVPAQGRFRACRSGLLYPAEGAEGGLGRGGLACVWHAATLRECGRFRIPPNTIWSAAAVSSAGQAAALATADGGLCFYDLASGESWSAPQPHPYADPMNCLAFSADGETMVSGGQDHAVKLWDVATGQEIAALGEHEAAVFAVDFSPDGRQVASGGFDKTVRLWNIERLRRPSTPAQARPALALDVRLQGFHP